ncbi:MAG: hypothetical protein R2695_13905 [Acidimicrobiales bacterium]
MVGADLDGDGTRDLISGETGQVVLRREDGNRMLPGVRPAIVVPLEGDHVFTCNPDGQLEQWDAPLDAERFSRRIAGLVVRDGIGEWLPSPSFVFSIGSRRRRSGVPGANGGCIAGRAEPAPAVSDEHVEATELVFPEVRTRSAIPQVSAAKADELTALYDQLVAEGLHQQAFVGSSSRSDVIQIGLNRRYGPTIRWLADRVDPADLCLWLYAPAGAFTAPPELLEWEIDPATPVDPSTTVFTVRTTTDCGVIDKARLLPPQVHQDGDRVEIALTIRPAFGPTILPVWRPTPSRSNSTNRRRSARGGRHVTGHDAAVARHEPDALRSTVHRGVRSCGARPRRDDDGRRRDAPIGRRSIGPDPGERRVHGRTHGGARHADRAGSVGRLGGEPDRPRRDARR